MAKCAVGTNRPPSNSTPIVSSSMKSQSDATFEANSLICFTNKCPSGLACVGVGVRAHHPTRGGEADVVAVHVGTEGGTNGFDHPRARALVCVLERHADRTESREVSDQLPLR